MNDLYVLEWSRETDATRVQSLSESLSANRKAYRDNDPASDFVPLIVGTLYVILDTAELLKPTLEKRRVKPAAKP